jgi:hypothetical protein
MGIKDYARKGYMRNRSWPILRYFAGIFKEASIMSRYAGRI